LGPEIRLRLNSTPAIFSGNIFLDSDGAKKLTGSDKERDKKE